MDPTESLNLSTALSLEHRRSPSSELKGGSPVEGEKLSVRAYHIGCLEQPLLQAHATSFMDL